jgi:hypothetical protein
LPVVMGILKDLVGAAMVSTLAIVPPVIPHAIAFCGQPICASSYLLLTPCGMIYCALIAMTPDDTTLL